MDISVSLPLDSDGFLRRACPTCEGEFKWRQDQPDDQDCAETEPGGYYCPLCGHQAPADAWNTPDQNTFSESVVYAAAIEATQQSVSDEFRNSSAVTFNPSDSPRQPAALLEPDDMMVVDPPCHPDEPVKLPEGAMAPLFCLICGSKYAI